MKLIKNTSAQRAGFSLLEMLVALVILAVGIVSILLIFPAVLDRQRVNTLRTMTTTVSQMQLNKVKSGDIDYDFHTWLQENRFRQLETTRPEQQYVQSWMVSCQPLGEINQGLYRVTLGLRLWDNSVEYYTTYVTDR